MPGWARACRPKLSARDVYRALAWRSEQQRSRGRPRRGPCRRPGNGGARRNDGAAGAGMSCRRRARWVARGCTAARRAGSGPTSSGRRPRRRGFPTTSSSCRGASSTGCRTGCTSCGAPSRTCRRCSPKARRRPSWRVAGRVGALDRPAGPALGQRTGRLTPRLTAGPACRRSCPPGCPGPVRCCPARCPATRPTKCAALGVLRVVGRAVVAVEAGRVTTASGERGGAAPEESQGGEQGGHRSSELHVPTLRRPRVVRPPSGPNRP